MKVLKSVCLGQLRENNIVIQRGGGGVKAGQVKETSAGKQHGPPKML